MDSKKRCAKMESESETETPQQAAKRRKFARPIKIILKGKVGDITQGPAHEMDEVMSSILNTPVKQDRHFSDMSVSVNDSASNPSDTTHHSRRLHSSFRQRVKAMAQRAARMMNHAMSVFPVVVTIAFPAAVALSVYFCGRWVTGILLLALFILLIEGGSRPNPLFVNRWSAQDVDFGTARMWEVVEFVKSTEKMEDLENMEQLWQYDIRAQCAGCILGMILLPKVAVCIVAAAFAIMCCGLRFLRHCIRCLRQIQDVEERVGFGGRWRGSFAVNPEDEHDRAGEAER
ncbi:hypothetical protein CONLIGDRAFT_680101 [Coniochaeta ligniaria NRRL 30616]|uniref:Uncharacterized protein n=1 Tax=Coniochaeta ligniaria NRRL 30616 TaxID=1408157 RepID=A0A1J7IVS8_9PEZI|nr:hypothetical protein CONLIGDRAFT_680101 [Coniochaeta ligniaria NRRL 30616]